MTPKTRRRKQPVKYALELLDKLYDEPVSPAVRELLQALGSALIDALAAENAAKKIDRKIVDGPLILTQTIEDPGED